MGRSGARGQRGAGGIGKDVAIADEMEGGLASSWDQKEVEDRTCPSAVEGEVLGAPGKEGAARRMESVVVDDGGGTEPMEVEMPAPVNANTLAPSFATSAATSAILVSTSWVRVRDYQSLGVVCIVCIVCIGSYDRYA